MIKNYAVRKLLHTDEFSWIVRSGTGDIIALVPDTETLIRDYPDVVIFRNGYDPIEQFCDMFTNVQTAIGYIVSHEEFFLDVFGDDILTDIQMAIVGDTAAAIRTANVITPAAKYWVEPFWKQGEDKKHENHSIETTFMISSWYGANIHKMFFATNAWKKDAALVKMIFIMHAKNMEPIP